LAEEKSAQHAKDLRDNAEKALKAGKLALDEAATEAEKTRATAKVTQLESQLKIRTEAFKKMTVIEEDLKKVWEALVKKNNEMKDKIKVAVERVAHWKHVADTENKGRIAAKNA